MHTLGMFVTFQNCNKTLLVETTYCYLSQTILPKRIDTFYCTEAWQIYYLSKTLYGYGFMNKNSVDKFEEKLQVFSPKA